MARIPWPCLTIAWEASRAKTRVAIIGRWSHVGIRSAHAYRCRVLCGICELVEGYHAFRAAALFARA
eukprot:6145344-Lingulodinium_polyedra.AAC.1